MNALEIHCTYLQQMFGECRFSDASCDSKRKLYFYDCHCNQVSIYIFPLQAVLGFAAAEEAGCNAPQNDTGKAIKLRDSVTPATSSLFVGYFQCVGLYAGDLEWIVFVLVVVGGLSKSFFFQEKGYVIEIGRCWVAQQVWAFPMRLCVTEVQILTNHVLIRKPGFGTHIRHPHRAMFCSNFKSKSGHVRTIRTV